MQTRVKQSAIILLLLGFCLNANSQVYFDVMETEEEKEESSVLQNVRIEAAESVKMEKKSNAKSSNIVKVTTSGAVIGLDDSIFDGIEKKDKTKKTIMGAFGETIVIDKKAKMDSLYFYKKFKMFPASFNGYSIELHTSNDAIDKNHWLKTEFCGIMESVNLKSNYSYLLGTFSNVKSAEKFLNTVVQKRVPNATIVEFRNGEKISK